MKNTYVKCADWSWEDKLLYIKACIGEDVPHNKICGHAVLSKDELLSLYRDAWYIYCCDNGMVAYDDNTQNPAIEGRIEVKLSSLKPRTKTEFIKCEYGDKVSNIVMDFENNVPLYKLVNDEYWTIYELDDLFQLILSDCYIYRKVETEIDERQEFIEAYASLRHEFYGQRTYNDFSGFIFDSGKFKLVEVK